MPNKPREQTSPPTGKPSDKPTPPMPTGPNPPGTPPPGPLPVPEYWKHNPLPPFWHASLNAAQVIAIQKVGFDRLRELDKKAYDIERERTFLHEWLATPPLPNG